MAASKKDDGLDVSLDLEDFTPRQLRKLLSKMARRKLRNELTEEDDDADEDRVQNDNDDLVNLHESHSGDPKTPKVTKEDLPLAENDLEDAPEKGDGEEMIAKYKKGRK